MGMPIEEMDEDQLQYPLVEGNPLPKEKKYAKIVENYKRWWKLQFNVALRLIQLISVGLGKDRHYFDKWFAKNSLGTFRSIHYLPRDKTGKKSNKLDAAQKRLTTPGHADSGFVTLLSTFGYPGLQVQMPDGEYKSIKPVKNNLVVNLGALFSQITEYKLKATLHRVVDIGKERWSSPFFMDPCFDAKIPANIFKKTKNASDKDIIQYGVFVVVRMRTQFAEWKGMKLPGEKGYISKKIER